MDVLFEKEMSRLKNHIIDKALFLMADESEIQDTKYFHILLGLLETPNCAYLVDCIPMQNVANHQFVIQSIVDVLQNFNISCQHVCLLITDAARD